MVKRKRVRAHKKSFHPNTAIVLIVVAALGILFYRFVTQVFAQRARNPSITILTPSQNSIVSGTTPVEVTVTDDGKISKVIIYIDAGSSIATLTQPPYTASWNTTSVIDGTHWIWVYAYDDRGNLGTALRTVTVANNPNAPSVSFSNLTECQVASGVVTFEANVAAKVGQIATVYFNPVAVAGETYADTTPPYSISWNSALTYKDTVDRAKVVAIDTFGNKAQFGLYLEYKNIGKSKTGDPATSRCPPFLMR